MKHIDYSEKISSGKTHKDYSSTIEQLKSLAAKLNVPILTAVQPPKYIFYRNGKAMK